MTNGLHLVTHAIPVPRRPVASRRRALGRRAATLLGLGAIALLPTACGAASPPSASSRVAASPAPRVAPLPPQSIALGETRPLGADLGGQPLPAADAVWLAMIDAAQRHLDIAQFYIANRPNSRMEAVIAAVERAARRGVTVRVLVDATFATKYPATLARLKTQSHIAVRTFDVAAHMGGVLHAKFFVVDRSVVWLGSQNFDWRSLAHIHELGVRFNLPAVVAPLQATFDADWAVAGQVAAPRPPTLTPPQAPRFSAGLWRGQPVEVAAVGSPAGLLPDGMAWELPALVSWIDGATKRVSVQLLSMHRKARDKSDFPALFDALIRAAKRGVAVSVLVAHWSKSSHSAKELSTLQQVPGLTVKFVTIPQHPDGFIPFARVIHSKYMVVDGERVWLGTSNWSKGYFHTSRNVGVLVRGASFAAALEAVFGGLWRGPYAETLVVGKTYPRQRVAR